MFVTISLRLAVLQRSPRSFLSLFLSECEFLGCGASALAAALAAAPGSAARWLASAAGSARRVARPLAGSRWLLTSPPTDVARRVLSSSPPAEPLVRYGLDNTRISSSRSSVHRTLILRCMVRHIHTHTYTHKHTHTHSHTLTRTWTHSLYTACAVKLVCVTKHG